jgi:hypothetical protein
MTELEFFPFHNRHIRFKLSNNTELSGLLIDPMNIQKAGNSRAKYMFIQSKDLIEWKQSCKRGDIARALQLQSVVNISEIVSAEVIKRI